MIRLDRRELRDVARIVLFANTPYSLCRALEESRAVRRMLQSATPHDLAAYYDRITARARRSEVDVGLAYAVLVTLLLIQGRPPVDSSRLRWGSDIEDLLMTSGKATQQIVIDPPRVNVQVQQRAPGSLLLPRSPRPE